MKKFVAIVLTFIMIVSITACSAPANKPSIEVDTSQFPDAAPYSEFEWPSTGAADSIPTPTWSNRGKIVMTSETYLNAEVGYTTGDDFKSYIEALYESGYSVDYFLGETVLGYMFSAENSSGDYIVVCYQGRNVMTIQLVLNSSN